MRAPLVIWVLLLSACDPGGGRTHRLTPPPEPDAEVTTNVERSDVPGRVPSPEERRAIQPLLRLAEETRALRFEEPVPFRVQNRDVITQFVRDQIDAEDLERARVFYVALGLLPPDLDIQELLIRVLGEQIVGYYDPEQSLMVIREDVAADLGRGGRSRELDEAEMVIVHELVHALQDQRLGLGARYREERTIDAENAFAALVEGDATLAMIGHMVTSQGQSLRGLTRNAGLLRMLVNSNPEAIRGQEIESAPPIVRLPLMSRYLDGLVYCATLHGEDGWRGVDDAHRRPPSSTEQILHPARYAAGEEPDAIALPDLAELTEAGLVMHEEDSLGELEMGIWFGLAGSDERNASAAEGWGGDRIRVYRRGEETALVWFTTWDDVGEATEAEASAQAVIDTLGGHLERSGRALLIVRGVEAELLEPVRTAFATFADELSDGPRRRN